MTGPPVHLSCFLELLVVSSTGGFVGLCYREEVQEEQTGEQRGVE